MERTFFIDWIISSASVFPIFPIAFFMNYWPEPVDPEKLGSNKAYPHLRRTYLNKVKQGSACPCGPP